MEEVRKAALFVADRLAANGHRALLAGGCVRDRLLGIEPKDFDIATDATPERVCALFAQRVEVGLQFGVVIVMDGGAPVEVATFRADGQYLDGRRPESVTFGDERADALRRDFTINGLFMEPESGEILDYVGGRADLEAGIVRAIGDPADRFAEDRLRLMRAVRFSARLGFELEARTAEAIRSHAAAIGEVSAERLGEELVKMMTGPNSERALQMMDDLGLLAQILPEVVAMKGVEQPENFHPEGDVFVHTLLCMSKLEEPSMEVALGTLLHDVAKPTTFEVSDRIRFTRHESIGVAMAEAICDRFRFSNKQKERIGWLVRRHLIFKDARKMRVSRLKRLLADEGFDDLAAVCRADALASNGDLTDYDFCMTMRQTFSEEQIKPVPLVNGNDLIALGLKPGPVFGELLEAAYTAQLEEIVTTRAEALAWLEAALLKMT